MKIINALNELNVPERHKRFLSKFLENTKAISAFNDIEKIVLFSSCARGEATIKSDIDIMAIGSNFSNQS